MEEDGGQSAGLVERAGSFGRSLVATPLMVAATIVAAGIVIAASRSTRTVDKVIRAYARTVLALYGVRLEVQGLENLPDGPAIYLFNHQSHMDPPSVQAMLPVTARFGAKIELFSIPIFGAGLRAAGILPIARDNLRDVLSVYREAAGRFGEGYSYILAPEGTRQEEPRIGPFKKGPFRLAVDGQVPLVPLVIKGTHEVLPKGALLVNAGRWRRTVRLRVLPPVATAGRGTGDVERLRDQVREQMVAAYDAL